MIQSPFQKFEMKNNLTELSPNACFFKYSVQKGSLFFSFPKHVYVYCILHGEDLTLYNWKFFFSIKDIPNRCLLQVSKNNVK